jgi:hypothetical protein
MASARAQERWAPSIQQTKNVTTHRTKKTKLNFDYTIKIVSINSSKQDLI